MKFAFVLPETVKYQTMSSAFRGILRQSCSSVVYVSSDFSDHPTPFKYSTLSPMVRDYRFRSRMAIMPPGEPEGLPWAQHNILMSSAVTEERDVRQDYSMLFDILRLKLPSFCEGAAHFNCCAFLPTPCIPKTQPHTTSQFVPPCAPSL